MHPGVDHVCLMQDTQYCITWTRGQGWEALVSLDDCIIDIRIVYASTCVCMCVQGYSRELFQFENDQFDNIAALVRFHVGGRHPISQTSGAVITQPVTRTLPLRVINERQAGRSSTMGFAAAPHRSGEKGKRRSLSSTHMDMLQVNNYNLLRYEFKGGRKDLWKSVLCQFKHELSTSNYFVVYGNHNTEYF